MILKIDPEFQSLLPPLAAEDRAKLEANIIADGCTDPITLWQGLIVDGHNRYEICTRLGLGFQTVHITTDKYPDRDAVMLWMLAHQEGRRNLADIDRIDVTRKKETIVARQAKERQRIHGGTAPGRVGNTCDETITSVEPGKTRTISAKAAGVGEQKYSQGKAILEAVESGEIDGGIIQRIRTGEATVNGVAQQLKELRATPEEARAAPAFQKEPRNIYVAKNGMQIAAMVTAKLDRITDPDKEFEPALRAA